ncbi:MAG: PQQ-dependent sugar dehydrogenase, partial [Thermomicrobiales bacterium]
MTAHATEHTMQVQPTPCISRRGGKALSSTWLQEGYDEYSPTYGFILIAALIAISGSFSALGTLAQDQEATIAQPGGDLPGDPTLELVQVAEGLIDPVSVSSAHDGFGRLFVLERTGTIRIIADGELVEEPFLDISAEVKIDFLEQGLLGLAFHPDYTDNGRFFVYYIDYRTNGTQFVVEFAVSADDPNLADPESGR